MLLYVTGTGQYKAPSSSRRTLVIQWCGSAVSLECVWPSSLNIYIATSCSIYSFILNISHYSLLAIKMRLHSLTISFVVGLSVLSSALVHDGHFTPDAILRVTEEERKQSCVPLKHILVVNGTSPGPRLSFDEGKTVWIRVYNDVHDQNLTMVWHNIRQ